MSNIENKNYSIDEIYKILVHKNETKSNVVAFKMILIEFVLLLFSALFSYDLILNKSSLVFSIITVIFLQAVVLLIVFRKRNERWSKFLTPIALNLNSFFFVFTDQIKILFPFHIILMLFLYFKHREFKYFFYTVFVTFICMHVIKNLLLLDIEIDYLYFLGAFLCLIIFNYFDKEFDDLQEIAKQQYALEEVVTNIELQMAERTEQLIELQTKYNEQQEVFIASSKLSSLGEMAGGIAHEINTPLAIIQARVDQILDCIERGVLKEETLKNAILSIEKTGKRVAKIVAGLRAFSRDGSTDPMVEYSLNKIIEDTLALTQERFRNHGIDLNLISPENFNILCRPNEISNVILNLLNNSFDAIAENDIKWINVTTQKNENEIILKIIDSGSGIPKSVADKMMQPFFTTKEIGKGTGLGLSLSVGVIRRHGGELTYDPNHPNTCFVIRLPIKVTEGDLLQ